MGGSEKAVDRRREQEPDIVIGPLAMWVGTGEGLSWPWIDVAVRIGTGWEKVVDLHGPMVQRPDLLALAPAIREFAERKRDDVTLASIGGSMRLMLRRSEYGSLRGEASFNRGRVSQTVSFTLWEETLSPAAGAEATAQRLKEAQWGWTPSPEWLGADGLLPRDSGIEEGEPEDRQPIGPWDPGLGAGEDIEFEYVVDGYGWYSIRLRTATKAGGLDGGYLTDPMGDLLRAGLSLIAGASRAELTLDAEPALTRLEFERVLLSLDDTAPQRARTRHGCRIRIREVDDYPGGETHEPEFEALCRSPRAVAEAIYRMALPHFRDGAGPWSDAMAALEAALAAVPQDADG